MEGAKTRALLKKVRTAYPAAFVYKINDRTRSGIPDSVLCFDNKHVWCEFKELRIKTVPSPLQVSHALTEIQKMTIAAMLRTGMSVMVVVFVGSQHYVFTATRHNGLQWCMDLTLLDILGVLWNRS